MQNKEIEEIKRGLTEELKKTITANECGLSTNDFSENIKVLRGALQYIDQLENKVEDAYWKGYIDKQKEVTEICKICKYREKALKIMKGEDK